MPTIAEELAAATTALQEAGCDTPRLDAELLLGYATGMDRAGLVIHGRDQLSGEDRTRYLSLVVRRIQREPIAYILGRRAFRRLDLVVDPRVLIPRPETELLVEVGHELPQGASVVDVGTGSGAVALALKDERPDLVVTGVDVSPGALSVARMNASRCKLEVELLQSDLLDNMGGREFDAVIANLPYVAASADLPPDVVLYEPAGALFSGFDGLDLIRRLIDAVAGTDRTRLLALELGPEQAGTVAELVRAAGFTAVERLRDLAGQERVVVGRR